MFAGNAAQGQLIDVEVARAGTKDCMLLRLPHAGMQATGDLAGDLPLHLSNVGSDGGEAVAPGDGALQRVDELHIHQQRAAHALCRPLDQIPRAQMLADLLRHQVLVSDGKGRVPCEQAKILVSRELVDDLSR